MPFQLKTGDLRPKFRVQLTESGDPADLGTAVAARFLMREAGGSLVINRQAMTFIDRPLGIVEYTWQAGDTDSPGVYQAEVEIDWGEFPVEYESFPSLGYFEVTIAQSLD